MDHTRAHTLTERVWELEKWRDSVAPMLAQLNEDQAYKQRWLAERNQGRAVWRRTVSWSVAVVGGLVVAAAAVVQLVHLL